MKKKFSIYLLIVTLFVGLLAPSNAVYAAEKSGAANDKNGLQPLIAEPVTEEEMEALESQPFEQYDYVASIDDVNYWTQFSSEYFEYYYLNAAEKQFFIDLQSMAINMAVGTGYYENANVSTNYVPCDKSISEERMLELYFIFLYSNPQYYFISNRVGYYYAGGSKYGVFIRPYSIFSDGITRKNTTQQFAAKVDTWVAAISAQPREVDKVKAAHDIVCQNTIYEYNDYDQSTYSMVLLGQTVCAGYAKTMNMLLNAAEIESVCMTGDVHAWNAVQVHGEWYELDATWDDPDSGSYIDYYYFLKSRATTNSYGGHNYDPEYKPMAFGNNNDIFTGSSFASAYFANQGNVYFIVNDNTSRGNRVAKRIEGTSALPATVTHNGKTYNVVQEPSAGTEAPASTAQVKAFVERMYTIALGRSADPSGLDTWTNLLVSKQADGAGLARGFILSDEFKNRGADNNSYIWILYAVFFDRAPDEGGYNVWMNMLNSGVSREAVLAGFVNSVEFDNLCKAYGISRGIMLEDGNAVNPGIKQFVERLYTTVLERNGDPAGVEEWAIRIARREYSPEVVAKSFYMSQEYLNKRTSNAQYVDSMYKTFFDRTADSAGKETWMNLMKLGQSRDFVLEGFARSEEFKQIMARYGL